MPRIWTSIASSSPSTRLVQAMGTRPRFAKSSRTRGITPGSARAWTAKQATGSERGSGAASMADLQKKRTNDDEPILGEDRGRNSRNLERAFAHRAEAKGRGATRQ